MDSIPPGSSERTGTHRTRPLLSLALTDVFDPATISAYTLAPESASALIIGDDLATFRILTVLWPSLQKPIVWVDCARPSLPAEPCRTVILEQGDQLGAREQQHVLQWFDERAHSVRVLTTSRKPLFPLVESGTFLDALYYRLNQVLVVAP